MTQNCDAPKIVARFSEAWRHFAGRMDGFCWRQIRDRRAILRSVTRFLDKVVVPWVVRINRGTIFSGVARFWQIWNTI